MKDLIRAVHHLRTSGNDYPVWLDGFHNVLAHGESSHADDNPFLPTGEERSDHIEYREGTRAAESLMKAYRQLSISQTRPATAEIAVVVGGCSKRLAGDHAKRD